MHTKLHSFAISLQDDVEKETNSEGCLAGEQDPLLPRGTTWKRYNRNQSPDIADLEDRNHQYSQSTFNVKRETQNAKHRYHNAQLRANGYLLPCLCLESYKEGSYSTLLFRCVGYFVIVMLLSVAIWLAVLQSGFMMVFGHKASGEAGTPRFFFPPSIQHSWGPYTPYFPVKSYTPPPAGCKINQVNIIQRHGSRFPTAGATNRILKALEHLQSATAFPDPRFAFLVNYTYTLGTADLMPYGALESEEAGRLAYTRYSQLFSKTSIPFVRSSGGTRVVDSATNWTAGFSFASHGLYKPLVSVVLDERLNDTLEDAMCPNAGTSDTQTDLWTSVYATPIALRLNKLAPGATVTPADISNLIPLCAFETLAKESPSPFCELFTTSEFAQYEYNADLDKYYGTGYGQDLGRVQGVGYINELLARLTGTPVRDNTQTNRTLDASPITFPLDRTLYADFSHDNEMIAIYAALGLFPQPHDLDPTMPDASRTWITSHLTPFSGRMVTERLTCPTGRGKAGTFVRILVNDAIQALTFCGGDVHGLCELGNFVESQTYARHDGEGDFERCGFVSAE